MLILEESVFTPEVFHIKHASPGGTLSNVHTVAATFSRYKNPAGFFHLVCSNSDFYQTQVNPGSDLWARTLTHHLTKVTLADEDVISILTATNVSGPTWCRFLW